MTDPVPASTRLPRRRRSVLLRFRRNPDGVVAVEFALLALPFFGIIFAILEVALFFWANQVLETMVADAGRAIYTGQFQQSNPAGASPDSAKLTGLRDKFLRSICYRVEGGQEVKRAALFDCERDVKIDVIVAADKSFPNGIEAPTIDPATKELDTKNWGYKPSGAGDVVVVRAVVEWPIFVSIYGPAGLSNGKRLLMATTMFRNEPFN